MLDESYARSSFDGAAALVARVQKPSWSDRAIGCATLGLSGVLVLGGVSTLALLGYDNPILLGAAALVGVLPFALFIGMGPDKSAEKILESLVCPVCGGVTTRDRDVPNDCYVLICHECRVIWQTDIELPSPGDTSPSPGVHHIN